ncbi:hypothetical protein CKA32_004432 [Geitlerinema sp. FC II]|nr:hypothetical protein CKA32_004432 [Geitlerinema sp. FC II]
MPIQMLQFQQLVSDLGVSALVRFKFKLQKLQSRKSFRYIFLTF